MSPPVLVSVALGLSAVMFLGYCVYFDRKRRSSPDFRKRLYERRHHLKATTSTTSTISAASSQLGPIRANKQALETYFLNEMRTGEDLISVGRIDEGLTHFANAVALCGQPDKVMQALEANLPMRMFEILISKLKRMQMMGEAGSEEWSEERTGSSSPDT